MAALEKTGGVEALLRVYELQGKAPAAPGAVPPGAAAVATFRIATRLVGQHIPADRFARAVQKIGAPAPEPAP